MSPTFDVYCFLCLVQIEFLKLLQIHVHFVVLILFLHFILLLLVFVFPVLDDFLFFRLHWFERVARFKWDLSQDDL